MYGGAQGATVSFQAGIDLHFHECFLSVWFKMQVNQRFLGRSILLYEYIHVESRPTWKQELWAQV